MLAKSQSRRQGKSGYTNWSVCSLHSHFSSLILSFQIASNLVSASFPPKSSILMVKKSAIKVMGCWPSKLSEPLDIFTRIRLANKIEAVVLLTYKEGRLVSSMESRGCNSLVHLNCNRAGQPPIANSNVYTWAFGLAGLRASSSIKRIYGSTLNTIKGLFVCI